jgi:hypothetical protein
MDRLGFAGESHDPVSPAFVESQLLFGWRRADSAAKPVAVRPAERCDTTPCIQKQT